MDMGDRELALPPLLLASVHRLPQKPWLVHIVPSAWSGLWLPPSSQRV